MTRNRGFTLVETLVYLALFALIIGGFVAAAYMLFETSDRNQAKAMMQEEQNFLIGKILWTLDNARDVVSGGTSLTVTKYDSSIVRICVSGTDAKFLAGAAGTCAANGAILNNSNVTIDSLSFIHIGGGANPESIEAGLTISAKTPTGSTISEIASTTRYIRK